MKSTLDPRNTDPLHVHTVMEDAANPWTPDTLTAHLEALHGVSHAAMAGLDLFRLEEAHRALPHGELPGAQRAALAALGEAHDAIYQEALNPARRMERIYLEPDRDRRPGVQGLCFASSSTTTIVHLGPADLPMLRAAVLSEHPGLRDLQDIWSANLGPGGRNAVEAGHEAGYKQAVADAAGSGPAPVTADQVISFLEGLNSGVLASPEHRAISLVLLLLHDGEAV